MPTEIDLKKQVAWLKCRETWPRDARSSESLPQKTKNAPLHIRRIVRKSRICELLVRDFVPIGDQLSFKTSELLNAALGGRSPGAFTQPM